MTEPEEFDDIAEAMHFGVHIWLQLAAIVILTLTALSAAGGAVYWLMVGG